MRTFPRAAPCALIAVALAGCGGSSQPAPRPADDEASKSPRRILADVRRVLGEIDSYHLEGQVTDKDGRLVLAGDVLAPSSLRLRLHQGGKSAEIVVIGPASYLRANKSFWRHEGGSGDPRVLALLTDRWVKVPGDGAGGLRDLLRQFTPRNLGRCLARGTGTVTKRGTAQLDGEPVVVLVDHGDRPGTSPGVLYVSASGPPYPLRAVQTGRQRPGGPTQARCGDAGGSTTSAADVRLSSFDRPVEIKAPPGALDLGRVAKGKSAPA